MKSRKAIVWLALLIVLALVVFVNRGRIHFDWGMFWLELRHIAWIHIAAGIAFIAPIAPSPQWRSRCVLPHADFYKCRRFS